MMFQDDNIVDYDYKLLYANNNKYIIYFDNRNIRATDIEMQYDEDKKQYAIKTCVIIVGKKNDYNIIQQSIGRCRYFFNVHFYFIIWNENENLNPDIWFINIYKNENKNTAIIKKMLGDFDILKE